MAKEPDQTRWVGIRPTDPSEDIPTTTKKLAPAIGDLQAVKSRYGAYNVSVGKNCTVSGSLSLGAVTAGEIWIVTNISAVNETTICDISIRFWLAGDWQCVKDFHSVEPNFKVSLNSMFVLVNPDYVRSYFLLGGAADTIRLNAAGYKIGIY